MVKHDPENGQWGDCARCAIAFMLGYRWQDVPHFFDKGASGMDAYLHIQHWLRRKGMTQIQILYPGEIGPQDVINAASVQNQGAMFILGGKSRAGTGHFVVCCDGEIIYDSSGNGIVGPNGEYYWVTFLGHAKTLRRIT